MYNHNLRENAQLSCSATPVIGHLSVLPQLPYRRVTAPGYYTLHMYLAVSFWRRCYRITNSLHGSTHAQLLHIHDHLEYPLVVSLSSIFGSCRSPSLNSGFFSRNGPTLYAGATPDLDPNPLQGLPSSRLIYVINAVELMVLPDHE